MRIKNLVIVGPPGVGKSTLVQAVVRELGDAVGGFFTRETRTAGIRDGFEIVTTAGEVASLARAGAANPVMVGKYGVDLESVDRVAVPAIERALRDGKIILIDEIARMEVASPAFRQTVQKALDSASTVLATMHEHSDPFTDAIKIREDIMLFMITPENRKDLEIEIVQKLRTQTRW